MPFVFTLAGTLNLPDTSAKCTVFLLSRDNYSYLNMNINCSSYKQDRENGRAGETYYSGRERGEGKGGDAYPHPLAPYRPPSPVPFTHTGAVHLWSRGNLGESKKNKQLIFHHYSFLGHLL